MAFSNLAANQMVSYTDAQSGGFTLNSGQSHVTSNQCMTKSDALTKYNLDPAPMSSYANNQLVPKSTWVANVTPSYSFWGFSQFGYSDANEACGDLVFSNLWYTSYQPFSYPQVGMTLYFDQELTIPINGNNIWWNSYEAFNVSQPQSFNISTEGLISGNNSCP